MVGTNRKDELRLADNGPGGSGTNDRQPRSERLFNRSQNAASRWDGSRIARLGQIVSVKDLLSHRDWSRRYSLLVVDDLRAVRHAISKMLEPISSRLVTASNGLEATELISSSSGTPFDLIVLDIQMPIMDGLATIRRLRADGHNVPVIALTASDDPVVQQRLREFDNTIFAMKPVSQFALISMVFDLLERT